MVRWTPEPGDLGTKAFTVVATDVAGNTRSQAFNLNVVAQELGFTVKFVDQANNEITAAGVGVGSTFRMQVFVDDLRTAAATPGVASAFAEVSFNDILLDAIGEPTVDARFTDPIKGVITANKIGAPEERIPAPNSSAPVLLFSQRFRAVAQGSSTFQTLFVPPSDLFEIILHGETTSLPEAAIQFGSATPCRSLPDSAAWLTPPSVAEDSTTSLDVLANDIVGPTSGTRTITTVTNPSQGGTLAIVENGGKLSYKPKANYVGTETFTYTVRMQRGDHHRHRYRHRDTGERPTGGGR